MSCTEVLTFIDTQAWSPWFYARSRDGRLYKWGWNVRSGNHWASVDGEEIGLLNGERGDDACHRHLGTSTLPDRGE